MGILFACLAALFLPMTSLFVRKSVDVGGTTKAFFVFEMAVSFLFGVLMNPVRTGNYSINIPIVCLGAVTGLALALMLFCLGRAVEKGPPGLTFAILNSATVTPGLLMALLFGTAFGFVYKAWHAVGSLLVLYGLFWAGKGLAGMKEKRTWALFATAVFLSHVLLLCLFQYRAMLLNSLHPEEILSSFNLENIQSEWFLPAMFFTCGICMLVVYLKDERRAPKKGEILYGVLGGITNVLCTLFLVRATEAATPLENAIIFPIYSVISIILTSAWGQKLYQEQVNWRACQVCATGLIIGTVDWKTVATVIGF